MVGCMRPQPWMTVLVMVFLAAEPTMAIGLAVSRGADYGRMYDDLTSASLFKKADARYGDKKTAIRTMDRLLFLFILVVFSFLNFLIDAKQLERGNEHYLFQPLAMPAKTLNFVIGSIMMYIMICSAFIAALFQKLMDLGFAAMMSTQISFVVATIMVIILINVKRMIKKMMDPVIVRDLDGVPARDWDKDAFGARNAIYLWVYLLLGASFLIFTTWSISAMQNPDEYQEPAQTTRRFQDTLDEYAKSGIMELYAEYNRLADPARFYLENEDDYPNSYFIAELEELEAKSNVEANGGSNDEELEKNLQNQFSIPDRTKMDRAALIMSWISKKEMKSQCDFPFVSYSQRLECCGLVSKALHLYSVELKHIACSAGWPEIERLKDAGGTAQQAKLEQFRLELCRHTSQGDCTKGNPHKGLVHALQMLYLKLIDAPMKSTVKDSTLFLVPPIKEKVNPHRTELPTCASSGAVPYEFDVKAECSLDKSKYGKGADRTSEDKKEAHERITHSNCKFSTDNPGHESGFEDAIKEQRTLTDESEDAQAEECDAKNTHDGKAASIDACFFEYVLSHVFGYGDIKSFLEEDVQTIRAAQGLIKLQQIKPYQLTSMATIAYLIAVGFYVPLYNTLFAFHPQCGPLMLGGNVFEFNTQPHCSEDSKGTADCFGVYVTPKDAVQWICSSRADKDMDEGTVCELECLNGYQAVNSVTQCKSRLVFGAYWTHLVEGLDVRRKPQCMPMEDVEAASNTKPLMRLQPYHDPVDDPIYRVIRKYEAEKAKDGPSQSNEVVYRSMLYGTAVEDEPILKS